MVEQNLARAVEKFASVTSGMSEADLERLLRHIYAALAEVESALLGTQEIGDESCRSLAVEISQRADEIAAAMPEG